MDSNERKGGYPGTLNVAMKLTLSPVSGEFKIEYSGMGTKKTPIDISNNILMNLAGHKTGKISCFHQINTSYYVKNLPKTLIIFKFTLKNFL